MSKALTATARWVKKMKFEGSASREATVALDVSPPHGDGEGIMPMELLLMSLAACAGQTMVSLLLKMRQDIRGFAARAVGTKSEDHPRVFTGIDLQISVEGEGLDPAAVEKAHKLAEEKYCPVYAHLKSSVPIRAAIMLGPLPPREA